VDWILAARRTTSQRRLVPQLAGDVPTLVFTLLRERELHRPTTPYPRPAAFGRTASDRRRGELIKVSRLHFVTSLRARNLPETVLRVASRRPTTQPLAAALTWAVVWSREVLRGLVNHPSINGKDGVAGSIPAD
jgi:hypothetical protein